MSNDKQDFILECQWNCDNDTECSGSVDIVDLFPGREEKFLNGYSTRHMPICQAHLQVHEDIMGLSERADTDELLDMSPEERAARLRNLGH